VPSPGPPAGDTVLGEGGEGQSLAGSLVGSGEAVTLDGVRRSYTVATDANKIWMAGDSGTVVVTEVQEAAVRPDDEHSGDAELVSPMPGSIVAVGVASGAEVAAGTMVVTVEAMKMEHPLKAGISGRVKTVSAALGAQVADRDILCVIEPPAAG